ncbi:MAG: YggS family pyridoxal phosphate-dependent enzyme [Pseudomonadota bacterium]|nr:YggS family pyridoxal phosphate-dependent enzyme [Pseudomonadota bacterium]
MSDIAKYLKNLQSRIGHAADLVERDANDIRILAVTKKQNVEQIYEAAELGLSSMGENYAQEALRKISIVEKKLDWHFIGKLQSNKTSIIAKNFDWAHTITSVKIAKKLNNQRSEKLPPLNICIQVCTDPKTSHEGCKPEETLTLCETIVDLPKLRLRGLMVLPHVFNEINQQRIPFRQLRILYTDLVNQGLELDTLSMGMSNDLEAAVMEGSTMLRIGTALFGNRPE